jgi:5-formyltetrahydrofolate cyclo-ligase
MDEAEVGFLKSSMRKEVLDRRNGIAPEDRAARSRAICERIFDAARDEAMSSFGRLAGLRVAVFSSIGSEVSLSRFEELALEEDMRLCFPAMLKIEEISRPAMAFFEVPPKIALLKEAPFLAHPARAFSREEVMACGVTPLQGTEIDFALIPLVAFDDQGGRLGYGGGNYDTFLRARRVGVCAVGVAFEEQRVGKVPREDHDLPVDWVAFG